MNERDKMVWKGEVDVLRATEKTLLCAYENEEAWIPMSQIHRYFLRRINLPDISHIESGDIQHAGSNTPSYDIIMEVLEETKLLAKGEKSHAAITKGLETLASLTMRARSYYLAPILTKSSGLVGLVMIESLEPIIKVQTPLGNPTQEGDLVVAKVLQCISTFLEPLPWDVVKEIGEKRRKETCKE